MRIALVAESMYSWGGGRDLMLDFGKAFEYAISTQKKDLDVFLLVPQKSWLRCCILDILEWRCNKGKFRLYRYRQNKECEKYLLSDFAKFCPSIKHYEYTRIKLGRFNSKSRFLNRKLKKLNAEFCLWAPFEENDYLTTPNMVYIPDFQHRYFPEYFSEQDIQERDLYFEKVVMNADHVMVTAEDAKKDIERFYPNHKCSIYVQPFAPVCVDEWINRDIDISSYNLPKKYFMISNQFWKHKSHITAFKALEHLYIEGYTDLHIVCTGKMEEYRDQNYIASLLDEVRQMKCRDNIHFLGHIPKSDQIQIMKGAIALIQMTLFEGNPGGNSVLDANSIGIPCILSDIPVNKEISYFDNKEIMYFKKLDEYDLANKMLYACKIDRNGMNEKILREQMNENKDKLSSSILTYLKEYIH